jgi:hypothetical protein
MMEIINTSRYIIRNKITKEYYRAMYNSDNVFSFNIDDALLYEGGDGFAMACFDLNELVDANDLEILECKITYSLKNIQDTSYKYVINKQK